MLYRWRLEHAHARKQHQLPRARAWQNAAREPAYLRTPHLLAKLFWDGVALIVQAGVRRISASGIIASDRDRLCSGGACAPALPSPPAKKKETFNIFLLHMTFLPWYYRQLMAAHILSTGAGAAARRRACLENMAAHSSGDCNFLRAFWKNKTRGLEQQEAALACSL